MPVKVLHLNCHLFKGTFVAGVYQKLQFDDDRRAVAIVDYVRYADPDVVILSEVWSSSFKEKMARSLRGYGWNFTWIPTSPGCSVKVGPEFILASKIPFSSKGFWLPLNDLTGFDKMSLKGVAGIRISATFVCFSHYESADGTFKRRNADQTVQFIRDHSAGFPVIFCGDLNIQEIGVMGFSPEYNDLKDKMAVIGLIDSFRTTHPNPTTDPGATLDKDHNNVFRHFDTTGTGAYRIDHMFSRGLEILASGVDIQNDLADHYPIWSVFRAI